MYVYFFRFISMVEGVVGFRPLSGRLLFGCTRLKPQLLQLLQLPLKTIACRDNAVATFVTTSMAVLHVVILIFPPFSAEPETGSYRFLF